MLLKMAFRNLFRQRRRSLLTGLSMGGGYMLFVFSMSLLEGSWGNIVDIFTYLLITDPSDSFDRKHNGNVEKINHFYDFDEKSSRKQ